MAFDTEPMLVQGAWRKGPLLIISQTATLPMFCVKCGGIAQPCQHKRTFRWHPAWMYLFMLPGLLVYALVVKFAGRRITIVLPLCDDHRKQFATYKLGAMAVFISAIPGLFLCAYLLPEYIGVGAVTALGALAAAVVSWYRYRSILRPTLIDHAYGHFKGASESFLQMLEPLPADFSNQPPLRFEISSSRLPDHKEPTRDGVHRVRAA